MSLHRYPCTAEAPTIVTGADHIHRCIHDALERPLDRVVEHECECGMTWRASDWTPKPPPDVTWLVEHLNARRPGQFESIWNAIRRRSSRDQALP